LTPFAGPHAAKRGTSHGPPTPWPSALADYSLTSATCNRTISLRAPCDDEAESAKGAKVHEMPLRPDWDRLLANCPGAQDGFPPPAVGFGAIDIRRDSGFEATNYLIDLGVKYLTVDSSPLKDCFRLRFKYGKLTGLKQSLAKGRRPQPEMPRHAGEPARRPPTQPQNHQSMAFRLGRHVGRWFR
jgi:hypothetical protein